MASRRRSRIQSISGNISDVQKRLRYLETRPAPAQLARKVVATQNIALRAIVPEVVADNAIVRRTLAPAAVISGNLSVVGDPDGAAVATENIQPLAVDTGQMADGSVTNAKLDGSIEDGKIVGISASKVGPDLLQDNQINGVSSSKLIGDVVDTQIAGVSTGKLIGTVGSNQIDSVDAATITVGLIQDDQIDGISGAKIIGGIDGALIVSGSVTSDALAPNSVTNTQMADDSVGYVEYKKYEIFADNIYQNSIVGSAGIHPFGGTKHIQSGTIGSADIGTGAITTTKIDTGAVTNAKIDTVAGSKITGSGSIAPTIVTGLTNAFTTMSVAGIGISRTLSTNGDYRRFDITISAGAGSNQLAIGNHDHAAGTAVASHTHPLPGTSYAIGPSGTHSGHSGGNTGSHQHGLTLSGNTLSNTSTMKAKKEIQDHSFDTKKLLTLKLKKYKYKNEYRTLQDNLNREWMYGYIAEEVQEAGLEEILGYDSDGEVASLQYGTLVTLAIELIKEQQNDIDFLKEEIQRLKEKI